MDNNQTIAYMNLAGAVLIFGAAIVPVAYSIWSKARESNTVDKTISVTLSIVIALFFASGWLYGMYRGPNIITLLLIAVGFSLQLVHFKVQKSPIDRSSVVNLVVQSLLVVVMLQIYFASLFVGLFQKMVP